MEVESSETRETLHDLFPNSIRLKKEQLEELERRGITVLRQKKFSAEEDKKIAENFENFFNEHGIKIDDEFKKMALGYFNQSKNADYVKKKKEVRRFLIEKKFLARLGKGLENRSIHAIYQRARKVLSPLRVSGDLTKEERKQMVQMKACDLNRGWTEIAEYFDVNPKVVNEVVELVIDKEGNQLRKGQFDLNEEICLVKGIMEVTDSKNIEEVLHKSISWEQVRKYVKNRNTNQCFVHWRVLRSRIDYYVKPYLLNLKPYTDLDSARLIYILYKERMKYDNVTDIDWDWIKAKFSYVGSLEIIMRWWKSLASEVPEKHQRSYFKLVKWLYKKKMRLLMGTATIEELDDFYKTD